jgi:transcriptional regulator with XRE-family HTH domain
MAKVTNRLKPAKGAHPGHYVREWRKYRGYSQEQLAEMLGVTHSAISQLETGRVNYTQPMLEALAEALNAAPGFIVAVNPLVGGGMWSIWEKARPAQRTQIEAIAQTILKTGDEAA